MVAGHGTECAVVVTAEGLMVVVDTVVTGPHEEGSTTQVDVSDLVF